MKLAAGAESVGAKELPRQSRKEKKKHLAIVDTPINGLESLGILNADKVRETEREKEEEIKNNTPREQDIMISEREKWKGSEDRLVKMSGFESYKKSAESRLLSTTSVDENGRQKVNFSKTQGVLINKKQA